MGPGNITSPDGCREPEVGGVGPPHQFVGVGKLQHRKHWPKNFLAGNCHFVLDVCKHGGLDKEALRAHSLATGCAGGAFLLALRDVTHDLVKLRLIHLGPLLGGRIERIAHLSRPALSDDRLDKRIVNRILHKEAGACAAALPLIQVDAHVSTGGRRGQVRIGKNDIRALATEFKRQPFERIGGLPHDDLCRLTGACKRHLVDAWMLHDRCPGSRPKARHNVDHAIGNARLLGQPRQPQARQRRLLGRFHHHGAAGGKRRPPLPSRHQNRKVPRNNLPRHAHGLAAGVGEKVAAHGDRLAVNLVGPACVIAQRLQGQRNIAEPCV